MNTGLAVRSLKDLSTTTTTITSSHKNLLKNF
jgi:hypothetical protein